MGMAFPPNKHCRPPGTARCVVTAERPSQRGSEQPPANSRYRLDTGSCANIKTEPGFNDRTGHCNPSQRILAETDAQRPHSPGHVTRGGIGHSAVAQERCICYTVHAA